MPILINSFGLNGRSRHHGNCGLGNKLFHNFLGRAISLETGEILVNWLDTKLNANICEQEIAERPKDHWGYEWPTIKTEEKPTTVVGFDNTLEGVYGDRYHQNEEVVKLLSKYKSDLVSNFGEEDGVFVHVRLGDLKKDGRLNEVPAYDYYKYCLSNITTNNFKVGYIASDSPDDPLVLKLASEFGLQIYQDTPENTIIFGSRFNTKILSLGTFSWWIGFIGNQNNVIYPNPSDFRKWHGRIFEAMEVWNSMSKHIYKKPIVKDGPKKVISFSLYGNKPNFQIGAVVFPDWKCRFYTTDDENICAQLEYLGAEVVRMDDWPEGNMFWRFLAFDDADVCLSRDADSVVNEREAAAVNEWLETCTHQWHGMHDNKAHRNVSMMGGMCGYRHYYEIPEDRKNIFHFNFREYPVKRMIDEWLQEETNRSTAQYGKDQLFLGDAIYSGKACKNIKWSGSWRNCRGIDFPKPHYPIRYGSFVGDYSFAEHGWNPEKTHMNEWLRQSIERLIHLGWSDYNNEESISEIKKIIEKCGGRIDD
jgi:hypothetical protein